MPINWNPSLKFLKEFIISQHETIVVKSNIIGSPNSNMYIGFAKVAYKF